MDLSGELLPLHACIGEDEEILNIERVLVWGRGKADVDVVMALDLGKMLASAKSISLEYYSYTTITLPLAA